MAEAQTSDGFKIYYPGFGHFKVSHDSDLLQFGTESFFKKEPTTLEWLQSLTADSILIDVGARLGSYTLLALLFHVKKVIAIEPGTENYNALLNNLCINQISSAKYEAISAAVSTKFGNQFANPSPVIGDVGQSCSQVMVNQDFQLRSSMKSKKYSNVYCVPLSQIVEYACRNHRGPIHIKIDVDGAEADVCQSLFEDGSLSKISSFQIKLNPTINEHSELIENLNCHGFYFDLDQVEKSCTNQGAFIGFAEYVFRRSLPGELISFLPIEIVNHFSSRLGKTISGIDKSTSGYFSRNRFYEVIQTSRSPASFTVKSLFDHIKCSALFHSLTSELLKRSDGTFSFASEAAGQQNESLRLRVEVDLINSLAPNYINELKACLVASGLTSSVIKTVERVAQYTFSDKFNGCIFKGDIERKRLVCRVRHFIDLWGYSLGRHHDSPDTLCALIAPIFPFSTSTSIVNGSPIDREYLKDVDFQNLSPDAFLPGNFSWASLAKKSTLTYFKKSENPVESRTEGWVQARFPYSLSSIDLKPGECLLIPNILSEVFLEHGSAESSILSKVMRHSGHGILPGVKDIFRPVILIDYLVLDQALVKDLCKTSDFCVDYGDFSSAWQKGIKCKN